MQECGNLWGKRANNANQAQKRGNGEREIKVEKKEESGLDEQIKEFLEFENSRKESQTH